MQRETENALHELIVVDSKYWSREELFREVVALLKKKSPGRGSLMREDTHPISRSSNRGGCCYKMCCCIPIACSEISFEGCAEWTGKCCIFMILLILFTGIVSYLFGAAPDAGL